MKFIIALENKLEAVKNAALSCLKKKEAFTSFLNKTILCLFILMFFVRTNRSCCILSHRSSF